VSLQDWNCAEECTLRQARQGATLNLTFGLQPTQIILMQFSPCQLSICREPWPVLDDEDKPRIFLGNIQRLEVVSLQISMMNENVCFKAPYGSRAVFEAKVQ
jgi:hypothetical protein